MTDHRFSVIAGIDLSMTNTGVAVFARGRSADHPHGFTTLDRIQSKPETFATGPLETLKGGKVRPSTTYNDRLHRMADVVRRVASRLQPGALVFLEAPSYGSVGSGTFDRSGLWWMLYATLDSIGATTVPVSPSQRMLYATGKGAGKDAGKDAVIAAVVRRYPDLEVTDNNVADAVVLLAMARRAAGVPMEDALPAANLKALDKLDLTGLDPVSSIPA